MDGPSSLTERDVGVDLAAVTVTASWPAPGGKPSAPATLPQTPPGFATSPRRSQATGVAPAGTRVVVEATSGYRAALAVTLHAAGYRALAIDAAQAHHFAKHPRAGTRLRRAKTDALDAQGLARLAGKLELSPWTPPPTI